MDTGLGGKGAKRNAAVWIAKVVLAAAFMSTVVLAMHRDVFGSAAAAEWACEEADESAYIPSIFAFGPIDFDDGFEGR